MNNIAPEKIQQRLNELPATVRAILFAPETARSIEVIGRQFKLMVDEVGELADEVGLVIMGFVSLKVFIANIAARLQIDLKLAEQIATAINAQIFSKIREELQKLNNEPAEAPLPPEPKPYTPPAPQPAPPISVAIPQAPISLSPVLPTTIPPATVPALVPPTPAAPKIETTPFEHKLKENEIFRAPAVVSEYEAPKPGIMNHELGIKENAGKQTLPPLPKKEDIKYGGRDPYREPIQ